MILKENLNFRKNIGEHYKCLLGCHGNIIRNTDQYESLKKWKWNNTQNCVYASYLNYELKNLKILLLYVK